MFLVSGIILCSGIQTYNIIGGLFGRIAIVVLFVLLFMWGVLFSYVFPLLAQFDNTIKNTIKNAFIISIDYYGAAEPPVRCGVSHLSGPTEPPDYYKLL